MKPLPLRVLIPLSLAATSLILTVTGVAYDRYVSYQEIEQSTERRALSLSHMVVPTVERALVEGDLPTASDAVERLALEPDIRLAVLVGPDNTVLQSTDPATRGGALADTRAGERGAAVAARARASGTAQSGWSDDRNLVGVASPLYGRAEPGALRPERSAVLYIESDLTAPKASLLQEIVWRSALLGSAALVACFFVWVYLRRTFTRELDAFVASARAFAEGRGELRLPTRGTPELLEIGGAMSKLLADLRSEHTRLRESEQRWSMIVENAPVLIGLTDLASGLFTMVNEEAVRVSGFRRDEIIGHSAVEIGWMKADERQRVLGILEHEGRIKGLDIETYHKSGARLECLYFADIVTIDGKPHLLSVTQDRTAHRRAERQFAESEQRFRELIERAPLPIGIARNGLVEFANAQLVQMYGGDPADPMVGKPVGAWVAPEARAVFMARSSQRDAGLPTAEYYETVGMRRDGTRFAVAVTATVVQFADGPATIGFFEDVSKQREAEARLRESEARFRAVVETSHDGIIFTDAKATVLYRSPSYKAINGFDDEERVGHSGFETVHPDDAAMLRRKWAHMLAEPETVMEAEYRIRHKDGSWRWIDTSVRNLLHNPSVDAIVVTSRDITERRRAEAERELLQSQLAQAQKIEAVGRLAGGVAHDFNNMLSVILGFTELALLSTPRDSPLYDDLLEIQKAGERSGSLTRQLLAFARREPATPKVVDLNLAVQDMLTMLRRLIGENIRLSWTPGSEPGCVRIDPTQVDQILANLCVNARDAIAGVGSIDIATSPVTLTADYCAVHPGSTPGEFVCLSVHDSGAGMSPEVMEHIFEPFFTTKGLGQGTGLGLATVYGVVKQNDGYIEVRSEAGGGTEFLIYFPAVRDAAMQAGTIARGASTQGAGTVLLVEDEPSVLQLTKRVLEHCGYDVLPASTPHEAIAIARERGGRIDLLLTDVVMPEMNGRQLADAIRVEWPDMKCLFTSGYTSDLIADHGGVVEGLAFLRKPWTRDELAARVHDLLAAH